MFDFPSKHDLRLWKQLVLQSFGITREVQANDGKRGAIVRLPRCQIRELALSAAVEPPFHFSIINPNEWIFCLIRKGILSNLPVG
jgi:hypothetical protein